MKNKKKTLKNHHSKVKESIINCCYWINFTTKVAVKEQKSMQKEETIKVHSMFTV